MSVETTEPADGANATVDEAEVAKFSAQAEHWWDPEGEFRPLHRFNPVRLGYIRDRLCTHYSRDPRALGTLEGLTILDAGCGGGLVSEPLARMGGTVTGIDASEKNIGVATAHAAAGGLGIQYRACTVEALAEEGARFDVVIALEIIEHVADPALFIQKCAELMKPGGAIILATLNRTAKSFIFAIAGAEYVLRWLPRGTHRWDRFRKPSELADMLGQGDVEVTDITGVTYDLIQDEWRLSKDLAVNYLLCGKKQASLGF
jgi:2-polyprenyl-6-hydroxyphenyl methylase/3-demethylubiquinone-9 3-methyltransferase